MTSPDLGGITKAELKLLISEAAESGAKRALANIGLNDDMAVHDVKELRDLLVAWRDTKRSVRATLIKSVTIAILGFIAGASYLKLKSMF